MAEARAGPSGPPPKKAKKSTPLSKVTAEARASQFAEDFYADGGILFCKICDHCMDYTRINTVKDNLKSKKHLSRKDTKSKQKSTSKQVSLTSMVKSEDLREEFIFILLKSVLLLTYH